MDQNSCRKDWKHGKDVIWEVMTWSEEGTCREKFRHGAESVRDMRGKEWDQNKRIAADLNRWTPKNFGKMMNRIQILVEGRVPAKELENRVRKEKNCKKGV